MNCIALQFQDVGSTTATASIGNLMSTGLSAGIYDSMSTEAPCIMIFDGVGYEYYYYISDAYDADGNEVTAWANGTGDEVSVSELVGTGLWLRVPEATCTTGALIQSGEVNAADSLSIDIAAGLTLAGNPFPAGLDLSKVVTTGIEPGFYDSMSTDAPCVMIYDGVGYVYYYYIKDAYDADGNEVTAWANGTGDAISGVIAKQGEAFWARSNTAGKITFTK